MNPSIRRRPGEDSPALTALLALVSPLTARLRRAEIATIARARGMSPTDPRACAEALVAMAWRARRDRAVVETRAAALRNALTALPEDKRRALLDRHLRETSAPAQRGPDLRALRRDLDLDAALEREAARAEQHGAQLEVLCELLGGLLAEHARLSATLLAEVPIVELLETVVREETRAPTRRAAVRALVRLARATTGHGEEPAGKATIFGLIGDPTAELWTRRAAMDIHLALLEDDARTLLSGCAAATGQDAFLIRARAVQLAAERDEDWAMRLLRVATRDASETVRFAAAAGLSARLGNGDLRGFAPLDRLLRRDGSIQVRRWAAHTLRRAGLHGLPLLTRALEDSAGPVVTQALDSLRHMVRDDLPLMLSTEDAIGQLTRAADPAVVRAAADLLAELQSRRSPYHELARHLSQLGEEESRVVRLPAGGDAEDLARALLPFANTGFGFSLAPLGGERVLVTRGDQPVLALWRILHELRNPNPTKRQGVSHAVGHADLGSLRVPPGALAEENATGVPGQRVRVPAWGGWVPGMPMVEDALHALRRGEVRIVTSAGLTRVQAPEGLLRRARAWLGMSRDFAQLDRQRVASLGAATPEGRRAYVETLRARGLRVTGPDDGGLAPWFLLDPLAYALTMSANTVPHLLATLLLLAGVLYGRVAAVRLRVRAARAQLPLSIGGWGTRGKSGTERLKAALFEGHGLPLLSKTTGCEAMVLHAPPGGRAMELFLFRPFDKASIWEQARVAELGAALDARVFLWECMGLNPLYVDLLQRGWMNDDLVTLTNAYPDHEDVQGPTGTDVARVIGSFAPRDALVLTAERSMLPILEQEAARQGSVLLALDEAEAELVPADLLARMPHAEHPGNVALVARMARELGLDPTEAIGLMADHVLPDLGALVITPTVTHRDRRLTFVNGMSANDEVSFRHNWRYTGFADAPADPTLWLMTVVNNRADRVPRSRVFARILVEQAHANRHVLIGTNLEGLRTYIDEALDRMLAAHDEPAALFSRLRIPDPVALGLALAGDATVRAREGWRERCAALPPVTGELAQARQAAQALRRHAEDLDPQQRGLADALVEAAARHALLRGALQLPPAAMKARYAELFRASLVFVHDPASTGDEIIEHITDAAPPGAAIRVMGVQNIKGTGLDFAYQWVFLRQAHAAGQRLRTGDPATRLGALNALETLPWDSAIVVEQVRLALEALQHDAALAERAQRLDERARHRLEEILAQRGQRRARSPLRRVAERLLDPFDAMVRAARARQILDDLAAMRISHKRAQSELKRLSLRQKGGWMS